MSRRKFLLAGMGSVVVLGILYFPLTLVLAIRYGKEYRYESSDGGFHDSEMPEKGRDYPLIEKAFNRHKKGQGDPEIVLIRTFTREPNWHYWTWGESSHPRWKCPYRPPRRRAGGRVE